MPEAHAPVIERGDRFELTDRLFEMLIDVRDEGERSLSELRFYALSSFYPDDPPRNDVIRRLTKWLEVCRSHGWVYACDARWSDVEAWLTRATLVPHDPVHGPGPEVATTRPLSDLIDADRVRPIGKDAWTIPEGGALGW